MYPFYRVRKLALKVSENSSNYVKYKIELWREHYNHARLHSSLNHMPPVEYAKQAA
ncbi:MULTISPECIES: integrase core domain-containing protein [Shewanella]|uniref:integrase core domain-containing protein n=1 Tax=Shewanella TaxID=22 RepID=UPI0021C07E8F|nr:MULTISPECIES: integrase core domain-containing protein [Shewanella]MCT8981792.1 integrase core domain-containing protein [Shewanella algae]MDE0568744.1 integrase core domain-containing protein [Shewanella sp. K8]